MKILSCEPHGVQERILQKRDDKALYKRLHKAKAYGLEAWILDGEKIKGSTPTAGNQSH
ncbi:MAG: hypothetical protein LR015_12555 [Verrucomicrobia bacterium]|nr:hypothetical protein [Verrucomicrobiota bacterium]